MHLSAVIRPGARDQLDVLLGNQKPSFEDPKGVFAQTNGAILYQE